MKDTERVRAQKGQAMTLKELLSAEPVARTDDEKANNPEAREVAEWLAQAAERRSKSRRPDGDSPAAGSRSRRTLRQMFAFGESLHDDEAGRWIKGAYSFSVQGGLLTPDGNDPAEEYARVRRELYGVRQKLVSLPSPLTTPSGQARDAQPWQLETSTDHQDSIALGAGRRKSGSRGTPLRRILGAVFTPDELCAIPAAVKKGRHRSQEQRDLREIFGAVALLIGGNVEALAADVGIEPRTLYRLIEEASLTKRRIEALEARVAQLEDRADTTDRRHFRLESDLRNQIARLLHGEALPIVGSDDERSLEERLSAFVATLSVREPSPHPARHA